MADMSEMLKNFSSMMEGNEIPDNIKELLQSMQNNNNSNNNDANNSNKNNTTTNMNNNSSEDIPNIDMDTIFKIQKIMSAMNTSNNSSGANLLRSLKPYLNPTRQEKVDEYIKLLNMGKVFEIFKQSGGDKKHDS